MNQTSLNDTSSPFTCLSSSKQLQFSLSTPIIPKCPLSIDFLIQRRWINSLLNSEQSKDHQKQLILTDRKFNPSSSISTKPILGKALQYNLVLPKKSSDKRRTRCTTFEEHLQRYYLSKWYLTYTKDFDE